VIFLVQNALGYELRNWWALFILVPALAALSAAYQSWRAGNTPAAAGSFTVGLVILAVATIFLLDLPWRLAWPVLIIIAGFGLLLPQLRRGRGESS
jgi:hypothetical protein